MIFNGLAWKTKNDAILNALEAAAKKNHLGIWDSSHHTPPWEHRKARAKPIKPTNPSDAEFRIGASARDLPRDEDGTVVGNGGGFTIVRSHGPAVPQSSGLRSDVGIEGKCRQEWETNYRMVKYCIENQQEAKRAISKTNYSHEIRRMCEQEWGTNYRMVKYCSDSQTEAKRQLGY